MILLSQAGSLALVIISAVIAILLIALLLILNIRYISLVYSQKNYKAENYIAYSGYASIASMIITFVLFFITNNSDLYNEIENFHYYGLFAAIAIIFIAPILIIADLKQIGFIKSLSEAERQAKNIGLKDRKPFIYVVLFLLAVNFALLGLNLEMLIVYAL